MRFGIDMLGLQSPHSRGRGIGRYARSLLEALFAADPGVEYLLYAHAGLPADRFPCAPNARVEPMPEAASRAAAVDRLARTNPDRLDGLLLLSPFEINQDYAPPARPPGGLPLHAILYDLVPFVFQERYLTWPPSAMELYRGLERLRGYDSLLAISEATRTDGRRLLGLSGDRIVNISSASDPGFFMPDRTRPPAAEVRGELRRLGIDRRFLFCVASMDERKNLRGLLDAFPHLPGILRYGYQLVVSCFLKDEDAARVRALAAERGFGHRLVLTGEVSDETLRLLYQQCEVFAFPSLYEGFGLPLLEALHCGAAVVAGNNSSQPEVVGDAALLANPADPAEFAAAIARVLNDPSLAESLRARAPEQARKFDWRTTAGATLATMVRSALAEEGRASRFRVDRGHAGRPRIAFFSPFPPKKSGISDYSARLVRHLARDYAVDLYHDAGYVPETGLASADFPCFDHRLFERNAARTQYRALVYQMGNSLYHRFVYERLLRYPGLVTQHDFSIAGFHAWYARQEGVAPDHFRAELLHSHPDRAAVLPADLAEWEREPGELQGACVRRGLHLARRVFERSLGIVLHSKWCVDRVDAELPEHRTKTMLIPYGADALATTPARRAELRAQFGLPADALVVCSLGIMHPSKMNVETVAAFAELPRERADARLIFVGPDFGLGEARRAAESLGVADRVRYYGHQPADRLADFADASDIGVCLRQPPTNGETSAALLDLLRVGVPTIVSDVGTFSDYPDSVVRKVRWDSAGPDNLARALGELAGQRELREALGRAALDYVREAHSWERAAALYAEAIERIGSGSRGRSHLASAHAPSRSS